MNFTDEKIEAAVLLECFGKSENFNVVSGILDKDDFSNQDHKLIFESMQSLRTKKIDLDILSIEAECRSDREIDIMSLDTFFFENHNQTRNIESLCLKLSELGDRRKIIKGLTEVSFRIADPKISNVDFVGKVKEVLNVRDIGRDSIKTNIELSTSVIEEIKAIKDGSIKLEGLSGLKELDQFTLTREGELIIMAARPGMGKTMLLNTCSCHLGSVRQKRVVVWTLEMSAKDFGIMSISNLGDVDSNEIYNGTIDLNSQGLESGSYLFNNSKIEIVDRPGITCSEMISTLTLLHQREPIEYVFIDHGGLIRMDSNNLVKEIGELSKELKIFARKNKCRVILLWQLSRKVEERGGKKIPVLSDLRDSGRLEEDADRVFMIYRPEYYELHDEETTGKAIVYARKNRRAALGSALLEFKPEFCCFRDSKNDNFFPPKPMDTNVSKFRKDNSDLPF